MSRHKEPSRWRLSGFELEWPTDWSRHFEKSGPIVLEIGFGRGEFLLHLSRRYPRSNIIGVEVSNHALDAMERRLERGAAANVRVVHAAAETALHHIFTPAGIEAIHINFPDPWFKKKHRRRRVIQRDTLDAMVSRLALGGQLTLATDIRDYALYAAELFEATPGLDNRLGSAWTHAVAGRSPTKYERRGLAAGRPAHYFSYRRNALPAPEVPAPQEVAVPHIGFEGPLDLDIVIARFEPFEIDAGETRATVLGAFRGRRAILFDVFVHEPTISQRVALILRLLDDGRATLGLSRIGLARPTPGIHLAVARISDWMTSTLPDIQIAAGRISVTRAALLAGEESGSRPGPNAGPLPSAELGQRASDP